MQALGTYHSVAGKQLDQHDSDLAKPGKYVQCWTCCCYRAAAHSLMVVDMARPQCTAPRKVTIKQP
jgi:hypothetical protein